ncbi:MAG: hypothetical protein MI924_19155, partial [Chloroflexales bacterium]|nr:hypothetical protein [Chloroflexales bacterium]
MPRIIRPVSLIITLILLISLVPINQAESKHTSYPSTTDPSLTAAQTSSNATPENNNFETASTFLGSDEVLKNANFSTGRHALDPSTYPTNYDFADGTLQGWSPSDNTQVRVVDDSDSASGAYLWLDGVNQWALSSQFTVPSDAQSLHFDYMSWAKRDANEQSRLWVEVFSGADFSVSTLIGTALGDHNQNWQEAVFDIQAFQGQTIKLRFRTDDHRRRDGRARIDNLSLRKEVPEWTPSDARQVSIVQIEDDNGIEGGYLMLNGVDQSALSSAFSVPIKAQSLHFAYNSWAERNANEQSRLWVEVFSGADFGVYTLLGEIKGSYNQGWQWTALDLQSFQGQTIK